MRRVPRQRPLAPATIEHPHARELDAISEILDRHRGAILPPVEGDLLGGKASRDNGRPGLTAEQVVRILVIKQMHGFSYRELAFHLNDSRSFRGFCRFGAFDDLPAASTLQENLKRLQAATIEKINRALIDSATQQGIEDGEKMRADSTVVTADIHEPTDNTLLVDAVRTLDRLLKQAAKLTGHRVRSCARAAKMLGLQIQYARGKDNRRPLYQELLELTREIAGRAGKAAERLEDLRSATNPKAAVLAAEIRHFLELTERVIAQTHRRVILGESVPAAEKLVSLFEPHTSIIVKDTQNTFSGHKIFLNVGSSSLVSDCLVVAGNPADASLTKSLVERHRGLYGRVPEQAVFDGGFASRENLEALKGLGVKDVVFSKARGIKLHEMVRDSWIYQRLRHFRAGIEAAISYLKHGFGLQRCNWRGFASFKAYVWASIVAANLLTLARHALT